jgi:hypothetical protein
LKDQSIYLTRYTNHYAYSLVFEKTSTSDTNYLTSLTVFYSSTCISGIILGYSDGKEGCLGNCTSVKNSSHLDLSGTKILHSFKSVCDIFCDSFIICSIDTVTQKQECITSGFNYTLDKYYNSVSLESMEIYSFFSTTYDFKNDVCISNLGVVSYVIWPSEYVNSVNLFRVSTAKSYSNFTLNINDKNELTSLIVNYNDYCITGLSFVYDDGKKVNVGYNGTASFEFYSYSYNQIVSVESRCTAGDDFCYFIRICSYYDYTICLDVGNSSRPSGLKKFTSLYPFDFLRIKIKSYYGDFFQHNGHNCIRTLGASYFLGKISF